MRKLTKEEKKLTEKNVEHLKKQIGDAKQSKEYSTKKLEYLEAKWKIEDRLYQLPEDVDYLAIQEKLEKTWKEYETPLKRKSTRENAEKTEAEADYAIKQATFIIEEAQKQLKEGVDELNTSVQPDA